ncbi:hypothetical protein LCGC14_0389470 [marine sediment metagenome]|uniref:Uncharacterized protein n=1 Tax=marine sediment metagenome TaxID=412755 RepID=A0A0F9T003_9ZZZZ
MSDSEKLKGCCVSCRHVIIQGFTLTTESAKLASRKEYSCSITLDRVTGEPLPCGGLREEFAEACGVTGTNWERKE